MRLWIVLLLVSFGCATDPTTGERRVDPEKCKADLRIAELAVSQCSRFEELRQQMICEDSALAGLAIARAACNIAEPIPEEE